MLSLKALDGSQVYIHQTEIDKEEIQIVKEGLSTTAEISDTQINLIAETIVMYNDLEERV